MFKEYNGDVIKFILQQSFLLNTKGEFSINLSFVSGVPDVSRFFIR